MRSVGQHSGGPQWGGIPAPLFPARGPGAPVGGRQRPGWGSLPQEAQRAGRRDSAGTEAAGGFEVRWVRLGPRSPCLLGRPARRPGALISVASRYPIWGMETNGSRTGRVEGRGSGPPLVSPCSRRPSQNPGRHSPLPRDTPLPPQSNPSNNSQVFPLRPWSTASLLQLAQAPIAPGLPQRPPDLFPAPLEPLYL